MPPQSAPPSAAPDTQAQAKTNEDHDANGKKKRVRSKGEDGPSRTKKKKGPDGMNGSIVTFSVNN